MLQVGCEHGPGGARDPGLTMPETRTHFYAWSIVSSPLTLSHNVNDPKISALVRGNSLSRVVTFTLASCSLL
jgi:hypothetical protein